MVSNAPIHTLSHDRFTIEGYSRAAVQTYWRIPEFKIGFDLGAQPWDFMGTGTWFVSHGHLDHLAALPVYVARRRMMRMDPPTIYLPDHTVEHVDRILQTYRKLDRGRLPCELIGIRPGDEIDISRELVVTVSATTHTVPSLGFIVWDRRHKLKPEFLGLPGNQIRDLRLSGQEITSEVRTPLLGYLGDTSPPGLDNCPTMFDTKVLIVEMTFVSPDHRKDKIHKHGHMHLDDFVARRDKFNNDVIIACHFSTRYHDRQIREIVQNALPDMLDGRLHLWL